MSVQQYTADDAVIEVDDDEGVVDPWVMLHLGDVNGDSPYDDEPPASTLLLTAHEATELGLKLITRAHEAILRTERMEAEADKTQERLDRAASTLDTETKD
jgi:hypothetical protein